MNSPPLFNLQTSSITPYCWLVFSLIDRSATSLADAMSHAGNKHRVKTVLYTVQLAYKQTHRRQCTTVGFVNQIITLFQFLLHPISIPCNTGHQVCYARSFILCNFSKPKYHTVRNGLRNL